MRGHGLVFRREFAPIAQIGDIVCLRNQDGFVTDSTAEGSPFYVVTAAQSGGHALGTKGVLGIWCSTANFAPPYQADSACVAGSQLSFSIGVGGQVVLNPNAFLLLTRQLMQARFLVRALPDSNLAYPVGSIEDFDVIINSPASVQSWGTQRIKGVLNARFQDSLGGDNYPAPTQGVSQQRFLGTPNHPFDGAFRSELFIYSNLGGSVTLINNGSAATTTGGAGLEIGAFTFNLFPLPGDVVKDWYLGYDILRPTNLNLNDVIPIPVAGQSTPKSAGS